MKNNSQNPQNIALQLIDSILETSNSGNKIQALKLCATLRSITNTFPLIMWDNQNIWKLAKVFLIMYHYDMYEDEDTNITLIHEAYLYAHRSVDLYEKHEQINETAREHYFFALHTQALILETCKDCFIPILSKLYSKKSGAMSAQEIHVAQQLSYGIIPYMQYAVLEKISETFKGFNHDSFLEDLCSNIELEHTEISQTEVIHAQKIHTRILFDIQKEFLMNHSQQ